MFTTYWTSIYSTDVTIEDTMTTMGCPTDVVFRDGDECNFSGQCNGELTCCGPPISLPCECIDGTAVCGACLAVVCDPPTSEPTSEPTVTVNTGSGNRLFHLNNVFIIIFCAFSVINFFSG